MDISIPFTTIRPAQPSDAPRMIEMGVGQFVESGIAKISPLCVFDAQSFLNHLDRLADGGLMFVADHNGVAVGMVGAELARASWNESIILFKGVFWYCTPEYRRGASLALLAALEAEAKARGVLLGVVGIDDGLRSEALGRLYRRAGYNSAEKLFLKVL